MSGPYNYLSLGEEPGQLCPITSQDTYASVGVHLTINGGGTGPGVQDIIPGLNISTQGSATYPIISMKTDLRSLNSVSFNLEGQGMINNLSTINGVPYTSNPYTATPSFSTITFPANRGELVNLSTVNGVPYTSNPYTPTPSFSTITFPVNKGELVNISSVNGAPYVASGAIPINPTFSTLQLSTIRAPSNPQPTPQTTQTLNMVIGRVRIQGGTAYVTNTGKQIDWENGFTSNPILYAATLVDAGVGTVVSTQGGNESRGGFSVNTETLTPIYWLAIGAA